MTIRTARLIVLIAGASIGLAGASYAQGGARPIEGSSQQGSLRSPQGLLLGSPEWQSGPGSMFEARSDMMGLIRRPEVQSEIGLDLRQKNELTAQERETTGKLTQQMQIVMRGQDPQTGRQLSPAERQKWMAQLQQQMAEVNRQQRGDLTDKVRSLLKPEQIARLHELDLQKRGPLALGDPRVAGELKLSKQTRIAEASILAGYNAEVNRVIREAMSAALQSGDLQRGNEPDFTSRLSPMRKKLDAARESAEKRALEALSDEEKDAWTKAQGKPFTFRADPAPRRLPSPGR